MNSDGDGSCWHQMNGGKHGGREVGIHSLPNYCGFRLESMQP